MGIYFTSILLQKMKDSIKKIANWMLWGFWAFIIFFLWNLAIQARQSTNPGLTEQSPTGGLYVNTNETLTAAKRNALANRVQSFPQETLAAWVAGTEQDMGIKRIDGKEIYRKIVHFGYGTTSTSKTIAHGISNLNYVIDYDIFWKHDNWTFRKINENHTYNRWNFTINATTISQTAVSWWYREATDLYVLIEYTKS